MDFFESLPVEEIDWKVVVKNYCSLKPGRLDARQLYGFVVFKQTLRSKYIMDVGIPYKRYKVSCFTDEEYDSYVIEIIRAQYSFDQISQERITQYYRFLSENQLTLNGTIFRDDECDIVAYKRIDGFFG